MTKQREEVLRDLDVSWVVRRLGIAVKKEEPAWLSCLCPFHEDKEPSFRIATDNTARSSGGLHEKGFWTCLAGCGSGSVWDLVIRSVGGDFRSANEWLGGETPRSSGPSRKRSPAVSKPARSVVSAAELSRMHEALVSNEQAMRWLVEERGVSPQVAAAVQLGLTRQKGGRYLTLPAIGFDGRSLFVDHLKFVRIGPDREYEGPDFFNSKGANVRLPFPSATFTGDAGMPTMFIVESELDALLLISHGYSARAVRGTQGFRAGNVMPFVHSGRQLVLWADADEPGEAALTRCARELQLESVEFAMIEEKVDGCKDPGEIWQKTRDAAKFRAVVDELLRRARLIRKLPNAGVWRELDTFEDKAGNTRAKKTLPNLDTILRMDSDWGDHLWMNAMGKTRMLGLDPLTDDAVADIRLALNHRYGQDWGTENVMQRVRALCRENPVHPVRDYLESLSWDGTERIHHLLGDVMQPGPNQDVELKRVYIRKWMISAVARVFEPGCKADHMLVLYSRDQGLGKSMFAAELAGNDGWFIDEPIRPDDKDCKLTMHRAWIVEVSELDATTRRRDLAELRAFVSKRHDHIRAPFARLDELYPRGFVFIGTTNDVGVVKEDDGRRYWPVEVIDIDPSLVANIRDQLWAEAAQAYHCGEPWWLDEAGEGRRRADTNAHFLEEDPLVSVLGEWLSDLSVNPEEGVMLSAATQWLKERGISANAKTVPTALRKCGMEPRIITSGRKKGCSRWFWIQEKLPE